MYRKTNQKNTLRDWLKLPVNTEILENEYDKHNYRNYYDEDDIDISPDNNYIIECIENTKIYNPDDLTDKQRLLDSVIERYDNRKKILIDPFTKHYHASVLFKKLINSTANTTHSISFTDENGKIIYDLDKDIPIFDKSMKKAFYRFCFRNSI